MPLRSTWVSDDEICDIGRRKWYRKGMVCRLSPISLGKVDKWPRIGLQGCGLNEFHTRRCYKWNEQMSVWSQQTAIVRPTNFTCLWSAVRIRDFEISAYHLRKRYLGRPCSYIYWHGTWATGESGILRRKDMNATRDVFRCQIRMPGVWQTLFSSQ